MSTIFELAHCPYSNSLACAEVLPETEAIDYFFAKNILSVALSKPNIRSLSQNDINSLFHVLLYLSFMQRNGSLCIEIENIATQKVWQHEQGTFNYKFGALSELDSLLSTLVTALNNEYFIVYKNGFLYSRRYYQYEARFCEHIRNKLLTSRRQNNLLFLRNNKARVLELFNTLFTLPSINKHAANLQLMACLNTLMLDFSIITGGAGTGKTYTITRLVVLFIEIFNIPLEKIELLAPTGKAANRMMESLSAELSSMDGLPIVDATLKDLLKVQAKTIHRLLKIEPISGLPKYNADKKLDIDLLIVDESSMVDISLMDKLLQALPEHCKVVLVGDANQLPSVENGSLLADLVAHAMGNISEAQKQDLCEFTDSMQAISKNWTLPASTNMTEPANDDSCRAYLNVLQGSQRSNNAIAELATSILDSRIDRFLAAGKMQEIDLLDWSFENKDIAILLQTLESKLVLHYKNIHASSSLSQAYERMINFALLTPFRKGRFGVAELNRDIEKFVIHKLGMKSGGQYYQGKPIIILQNDYQLDVFNGDLGIIWPNSEGKLCAYIKKSEESFQCIPLYALPPFETTYAMTIHKTQGSEFNEVSILLPDYKNEFINKHLLYTGVTRAKNRVSVIGDFTHIEAIINRTVSRVSGISSSL